VLHHAIDVRPLTSRQEYVTAYSGISAGKTSIVIPNTRCGCAVAVLG
jgi:hypothetical protein